MSEKLTQPELAALVDAIVCGTGVMRDGEHIPIEDFRVKARMTDDQIAAIRDGCEGRATREQPLILANPEAIHALATEVLESRAEIKRLRVQLDDTQEDLAAYQSDRP